MSRLPIFDSGFCCFGLRSGMRWRMTENSTEQLKETSIRSVWKHHRMLQGVAWQVWISRFTTIQPIETRWPRVQHIYCEAYCCNMSENWRNNSLKNTSFSGDKIKHISARFHKLCKIMKKVTCLVGESAPPLVDTKFTEARSRTSMNATRLLLKEVCYNSSKN